jgi:hypothetical protein
MQLPYVSSPEEAFMAAQVSAVSVLTVVVWSRAIPYRLASLLLVLGMWVAALASPIVRWIAGSSWPHPAYVERMDWVLSSSSLLYILAMLLQRRRSAQVAAVLGAFLLDQIGRYLVNSDAERAALQLIFGAILCGLGSTPQAEPPPRTGRRLVYHETALFVLGLAVAGFVAVFVLDRFIASGDEWAYIYQADLFAHGKLYGPPPECPVLQWTYWLFNWQGRYFSQYTPAWPLVLAPFQRLGVHWLANPIVFGLLLVGVSRLARRAASGDRASQSSLSNEALAAGWIAPAVLAASGAMLLNAGSLFSHPLVCALFAWSAEALFVVTSPGLTKRAELGWAFALGALAAFLLGTRPGDGAAILPGMAVYALYALARRRLSFSAVGAALVSFALVAAVILSILRVQLGEWFTTGYSLTERFHPWATIRFAWPGPDEWKYGIPLATGAYCFWPCSAAVAAMGVVMAVRRGLRLPLVLCSAAVLIHAFYSAVVIGRHHDWGYGPRYLLAILVPMAVFNGVALARLFARLDVRHLVPLAWARFDVRRLVPVVRAVAAVAAMIYGTWAIGRLLYPVAMTEIRRNGAPFRAIKEKRLTNALVAFGKVAQDLADMTQNFGTQANPDVIYVMDGNSADMECARRFFGNRKWYRVSGIEQIEIRPYD